MEINIIVVVKCLDKDEVEYGDEDVVAWLDNN